MSKLSTAIVIVVFLVIIRHIINLFQASIMIASDEIELGIYSLAQSVIMIIMLIGIISYKKWALIGFFLFQFANALILPIFSADYLENFIISVIVALVMSCLLSLMLLLKSNGIMGWRVFFPKQS